MLQPNRLPLAKGFEPQMMMHRLCATSAKANPPKVAIPFNKWGIKHSLAAEQRFTVPYTLRNLFIQNMAIQFFKYVCPWYTARL
jgi:hypothetical protein